MGQKVNPIGFRLGVNEFWRSYWFAGKKEYGPCLKQDYDIRKIIQNKYRHAALDRVLISRQNNQIKVQIYAAKSGVIIGKKGGEIDQLKKTLIKKLFLMMQNLLSRLQLMFTK